MKRHLLPAVLLAILLSLLTSCQSLPALTLRGDVFENQKTGISYEPLPLTYEASSYAENTKAVARVVQKGMDDFLLYEIDGMNPSEWLCGADYSVFRAVGTAVPSLTEMAPGKVLVYQPASVSSPVSEITDTAEVEKLVACYVSGISFSSDELDGSLQKERFDLKFVSSTYPGLYFCLTRWKFNQEVLISRVIPSPDRFTPDFPGVPVTTEEFTDSDGTEYYAVYHFGTSLLYDRSTGICYPES